MAPAEVPDQQQAAGGVPTPPRHARALWLLLHPALSAATLIPFFALTPSLVPLLVATATLAVLATGGAAAARWMRPPAAGVAASLALAATAGVVWAALATRLFGQAEGGAKLVLLAAMVGVPASACAAVPFRLAAAGFVVPAAAGNAAAVLIDGGPSGLALAMLQIAVVVSVLFPRPSVAARSIRPEGAEAERPDAEGELLRFLAHDDAAEGDWLWETDESLALRNSPARMAHAAGRAGSSLEGTPLLALLDATSPGAALLRAALDAREPFRGIVVGVRASDPHDASWWRLGGRPIVTAKGDFAGYRGLGSDVTALGRAERQIAHLAARDTLTGLANRETFQSEVAKACLSAAAGGPKLALLLLDLDGFKQLNDTLGHGVGDELLTSVAAMLTSVTPEDAIVARLGGDEFAVLFRPTLPSAPDRCAAAIVEAISLPFILGEHQAALGVNIGIALAPQHAGAPRDLARKADLALGRARSMGRNRSVTFEDAFEREREEQLRLEQDIGLALERNEFTLHYQPLLDIAGGRIGACEALIRWRSPTRGDVSPAAFIPVAEKARFVIAIGRFVLGRACRDAAAWPLPAVVAVNISPQHLRSAEFKADVVQALRESGLPPSRLEIEITEGVFLDQERASLDALTWLRERGIKVALDDFGTGYSSLNYLINFPVDKIKIDRSFITGVVSSTQSRAVVDAILTLARTLGLRVVAEGVETVEQALALKLRRCDDLQGYLISRPQPGEAIGKLLVELPDRVREQVPALLDSSLAAALVMKRSA